MSKQHKKFYKPKKSQIDNKPFRVSIEDRIDNDIKEKLLCMINPA